MDGRDRASHPPNTCQLRLFRRPLASQPTEQYEQVDLVWYYDDSNMVKLGQELVDGKLSIVMGREENDRTRTITIVPIQSSVVRVRFLVKDRQIQGQYRVGNDTEWKVAGECDLPVKGAPNISVQCYQGPATVERWVRIAEVVVEREAP